MEMMMAIPKLVKNIKPRERDEAIIWIDGQPQRCKVQKCQQSNV